MIPPIPITDIDRYNHAADFLRFLHPVGTFEIRGLPTETAKDVPAGLFDNHITAVKVARHISEKLNRNVYYTVNRVSHDAQVRKHLSRFNGLNTSLPYEHLQTTKDSDVSLFVNHYIDFDPVRPSGTPATDEMISLAWTAALKVRRYLTDLGLPQPVVVFSGNGFHLIYRGANDSTTKANIKAVKYVLAHLAEKFPSEETGVGIDQVVYNPSRIARLPGFLNRKAGRMAYVVHYPDEWIPASFVSLAYRLGYSQKTAESFTAGSTDEQKILDFIEAYDLDLDEIIEAPDRTVFKLASCPIAGEMHSGANGGWGITKIFLFPDGGPGFCCFHPDCQYTFMAMVEHLEEETGIQNTIEFYPPKKTLSDDLDDPEYQAMFYGMFGETPPEPEPPPPAKRYMTPEEIREYLAHC